MSTSSGPPPAAHRGRRIERASPDDLMALATDVPDAPSTVAAVLLLGRGPELDPSAVRSALADRIRAVPRLRQRLVRAPPGCGRPFWVDDPGFDIADHVRTVRAPEPGDEAAVLAVAADTITHRLPLGRPPWSATLVCGPGDGGTALIVVVHHVLADGIGGLAVLARLVDGAPAAPAASFPALPPRPRELLVDALRGRLGALRRLPARARRLGRAIAQLVSSRTVRVPRSSLNRPIGPHRALGVVRVELAAVRAAGHAHGATVNDVVLTAVAGALRAVLSRRGESADRFTVSVPISARRTAGATRLGNDVGVILVEVLAAGDPGERLVATAGTTRSAKSAPPDTSGAVLGPAFRTLARLGVLRWFVDRQRLVSTFVTDLHGPDTALSLLGAPVTGIVPVSPITGNVTVAFAVLSYAGMLVVTVIADPQRWPDLPVLVTALDRELRVLTGGSVRQQDRAQVPARGDG